jgi:iron-sulfur cluster repair protein YtfE (RIC family)
MFCCLLPPWHLQKLAWEIIRELSMHSIKEEESLYPAIKWVLFHAIYLDHMICGPRQLGF